MPSNNAKYSEEMRIDVNTVYLAVDLYNREVIGYSIGKSIDTELVKRALIHAV